jgi:hypothetical protein
MITEAELTEAFRKAINHRHGQLARVLEQAYLKVITQDWGFPSRRLQYLGIYGSEGLIESLMIYKKILRKVANDMGLAEVVLINAKPLLRDPKSQLKWIDPKLWLELQWMSQQRQG